MKKTILALITSALFALQLNAQIQPRTTIEDYLDAYLGTNARPYLQPLADLVTSNIHTGVWDWAAISKDKLYVKIKAQGMMSIPIEDMRDFSGTTSGDFTPVTTVNAPTIIGDESAIIITGDNNNTYVFPGGYDLNELILGTPQLTIGGFLNTEISGRFLAIPFNNNIGDVDLWGLGIRHSLSNYFEDSPIDLSVGYFHHHLHAGNYLNSNQNLYSLMIGKSGPVLSGHISANYQTGLHNVDYMYEDGATQYDVNMDVENSHPWLWEVGAGMKLGPVMINGAVSYSYFPTFALGAGLTF